MTVSKLARKTVRELTPYQSARRLGGSGDICSMPMNPLSPMNTTSSVIASTATARASRKS